MLSGFIGITPQANKMKSINFICMPLYLQPRLKPYKNNILIEFGIYYCMKPEK